MTRTKIYEPLGKTKYSQLVIAYLICAMGKQPRYTKNDPCLYRSGGNQ